MTLYLHATNCRVPFETVDIELLAALGDYRIGAPLPATPESDQTRPVIAEPDLLLAGIVGLYVTRASLMKPEVMRKCGWGDRRDIEKELGAAWRPFPISGSAAIAV